MKPDALIDTQFRHPSFSLLKHLDSFIIVKPVGELLLCASELERGIDSYRSL